MRADLQHLVALSSSWPPAGRGLVRTAPYLLGVLVLFANAYAERFLADDPHGFFLSVFLLLQGGLVVLVGVMAFFTRTAEILQKSAVFPLAPATRFWFLTWSGVRDRTFAVLMGVNLVSMAVIYGTSWGVAVLACLTFALIAGGTIAWLNLLFLWLMSREIPPEGALVVISGAGVLLVLVSLLFGGPASLVAMPPLSAAVSAIRLAQESHVGAALLRLLPLGLALGVAPLLARRVI